MPGIFIQRLLLSAETITLLYKAIQQLPSQYQKVFTKLYIEGKSVFETAEEINFTISTIKNQKARGLKLLKPKLSSLPPAGGGRMIE